MVNKVWRGRREHRPVRRDTIAGGSLTDRATPRSHWPPAAIASPRPAEDSTTDKIVHEVHGAHSQGIVGNRCMRHTNNKNIYIYLNVRVSQRKEKNIWEVAVDRD